MKRIDYHILWETFKIKYGDLEVMKTTESYGQIQNVMRPIKELMGEMEK